MNCDGDGGWGDWLAKLAGRGYNLLLVSRGKEGLKRATKELREASRCRPPRPRSRSC